MLRPVFSDWSVRDFELYWHIFLEGKENVVSTHSEPNDKIFGMGGRKRNRVSNFWNWGRGKACFSMGSKIDLFCEIDIIFITYTFCMFMLFVCLFASFRPSISMAGVLLLFQMFLATCIFRDGEFPNITINVDNR